MGATREEDLPAVLLSDEIRRAVRLRRCLGPLEIQWQHDRFLRDHYHHCKRAVREISSPHAGDNATRITRSMAERRFAFCGLKRASLTVSRTRDDQPRSQSR